MANKKQITVLVTGVFDCLHQEHLNFLNKARALGDILLIGIETDKRVKEIKGQERPVNNQEFRIKNLEKLDIANKVFLLPEDFSVSKQHLAFIKKIRPNILAVSSHTPNLKQKKEIMEKMNGKLVVVMKQNPKLSTTKIINQKLEKK
jgi:D-glycero-beta-D-manno-heptose 1-phosphate adenylyltransferase